MLRDALQARGLVEMLFQLANLWILPFWLLMIFLPHWRWTKRIIGGLWTIVPLALAYTVLILPQIATLLPVLANPTLVSLASLLSTPEAAAIGWIHFLAFDLFVGRWVYLDSREHQISAWLASPVLFFVLMFGPFGFVLYWLLRLFIVHKV
jgi:hypothetical protein